VVPPKALFSKKAALERARLKEMFATLSSDHLEQVRIDFSPAFWQATKADLSRLFNSKCTFCESPLQGCGGDIEHFRPRRGAMQEAGRADNRYYAWLAYEWDNLYLACLNCTRLHKSDTGEKIGKGSVFPVLGPRARILATVEECRR
jgi:hypothetical protein